MLSEPFPMQLLGAFRAKSRSKDNQALICKLITLHIHTHIHMCIYIYAYINKYICTCVCICA